MKIPKKDTRTAVKVGVTITAEQFDSLTVAAMQGGYSAKELAEIVLKTWIGTVRASPQELQTAAALNAKEDEKKGQPVKA